MAIAEFPDDVTAEGLKLFIRATGNFSKFQTSPLMTAEEFKEAMEKAKNVKTGYTGSNAKTGAVSGLRQPRPCV